jgi:hypothetical protein
MLWVMMINNRQDGLRSRAMLMGRDLFGIELTFEPVTLKQRMA